MGILFSKFLSFFKRRPLEKSTDSTASSVKVLLLLSVEQRVDFIPDYNYVENQDSDIIMTLPYSAMPHLNPGTAKFYAESIVWDPKKRRTYQTHLKQLGADYLKPKEE